jgi:DNA-binding transcriptional LysR family regulator
VANNANALLAAAVHGSGVALLPHGLAQRAVKAGQLQPVLSHWTSPTLGIYLAYSSRRHLPARVRALIDHVAERFTEDTSATPSPVPAGEGWGEGRAVASR